jgi:hypothetical protein
VGAIIFDIETGPLPDDQLLPMMPLFDPAEVKCGNLGPAKAVEKIAAAEASHKARFIERAALSALTGRVLAIGYDYGAEILIQGETERENLLGFWQLVESRLARAKKLVGHNIFGFDLPFLMHRSWALRVTVPAGVREQSRYWSPIFVDTMTTWQLGNYRADHVSLDRLARFFGIGGKPEGVTGADFARLWETDRPQAEAYLRNDLEMTRGVASRMGLV